MKPKIAFKYFFKDFVPNSFLCMFPFLSKTVEVVDEADADLVIFSVWNETQGATLSEAERASGRFHSMPTIERSPAKLYLFWSGENAAPDMTKTDFAISHVYEKHPNHLRLPFWVMRLRSYGFGPEALLTPPAPTAAIPRRICNFLYSHPVALREDFTRRLGKMIDIVSPGRSLNNSSETVPTSRGAKEKFLSDFMFTIAFENAQDPGYTTEKILDPLLAGSVPIYWGDPHIADNFDKGCFIAFDDFRDAEDLGRYVESLIADPGAYRRIREAARFPGDVIPDVAKMPYTKAFFDRIFDQFR